MSDNKINLLHRCKCILKNVFYVFLKFLICINLCILYSEQSEIYIYINSLRPMCIADLDPALVNRILGLYGALSFIL